eukprot:566822-Pelagomonas_calceolata.AAC.3
MDLHPTGTKPAPVAPFFPELMRGVFTAYYSQSLLPVMHRQAAGAGAGAGAGYHCSNRQQPAGAGAGCQCSNWQQPAGAGAGAGTGAGAEAKS